MNENVQVGNIQTRVLISENLEKLNQLIPQKGREDNEVKALKAEIATLNVKLASLEESMSVTDFSNLVESALDPW